MRRNIKRFSVCALIAALLVGCGGGGSNSGGVSVSPGGSGGTGEMLDRATFSSASVPVILEYMRFETDTTSRAPDEDFVFNFDNPVLEFQESSLREWEINGKVRTKTFGPGSSQTETLTIMPNTIRHVADSGDDQDHIADNFDTTGPRFIENGRVERVVIPLEGFGGQITNISSQTGTFKIGAFEVQRGLFTTGEWPNAVVSITQITPPDYHRGKTTISLLYFNPPYGLVLRENFGLCPENIGISPNIDYMARCGKGIYVADVLVNPGPNSLMAQ